MAVSFMHVDALMDHSYYIERLHIYSSENKYKNNHGYGVKSAILLYKFQCVCCDKNSYLIEVYGSTAF